MRGGLSAGVALVATIFLTAVSPAWAGVGLGVTVTFPSSVTVGQTGLAASLRITNLSTSPENAGNVTLNSINLVPACGTTAVTGAGDCPLASADPGVFTVSPTGIGTAGTACAGQTFTISIVDPVTGQLAFTPLSPVVLGPPATPPTPAQVCQIDFAFDVSKEPTRDADPATPGVQTDQLGYATGTSAVNASSGFGSGSSSSTVTKAAPGLTTTATATSTVGASITDTAALSAAVPPGPAPTGTITFTVYGPGNAGCTGTPAFTSTKTVTGNGTYPSDAVTPTLAGTYRWVASYSGDANNAAATTACGDNGETSTITQAAPTLTTTASAPVPLGGTISDSGVLAGAFNPTGTITFTVYGPGNAGCTGTPAFTSTKTVTGNGNYASDPFTPTAPGAYNFVAVYSGDANNATVTSPCGSANETATVGQVTPVIVTAASFAGGRISDAATLSGGSAPTGTITFNLYGPSDSTCSSAPVSTSTQPVNGNGPYSSSQFTPTAAGTYRFVASYSGDTQNRAVATTCADSGESVAVSTATPVIVTQASAAVVVGGPIADTATLSGGISPTGTITFTLFGPANPSCSGAPIFTSTPAVSGNRIYGSQPFTTQAAGIYEYVASYSGDASNTAVATKCGDAGELVIVVPAGGPPPAPVLGSVTQSARRWRAGNSLAQISRAKAPVGTKFSFTLNEAAKVSFAFTHKIPGRKVKKGRCVAQTKGNRHKPSCRRTVAAGALSFTGHSGTNKVSFQGRISKKKKLSTGTYQLVITATNSAGQTASSRLTFTIVK